MNKFISLLGTTLGGALVGAGIQQAIYTTGKVTSKLGKALGNGNAKLDETTWALLIGGVLVIACGIYFNRKK